MVTSYVRNKIESYDHNQVAKVNEKRKEGIAISGA